MNLTTSERYLQLVQELQAKEFAITKAKNADYSGEEAAFKNFDMVEKLGICSAETGILVRMTDKISRIINLKDGKDAKVSDEKITDTLMDLVNYTRILLIYIITKEEQGIQENSDTPVSAS